MILRIFTPRAIVVFCLSFLLLTSSYSALSNRFINKGKVDSQIKIKDIHTDWKLDYGRSIKDQNKYNRQIRAAVVEWSLVDPLILKSIIAQESEFGPYKRNCYGYAGICQLGSREAKSVGLKINYAVDERYDPDKAIKACVLVLRQKMLYLHEYGFKKYGFPENDEYWRFISAAYNAGEGTICKAMQIAYGDQRPEKVEFSDLVYSSSGNIKDSPLYKAMPRRWRGKAK